MLGLAAFPLFSQPLKRTQRDTTPASIVSQYRLNEPIVRQFTPGGVGRTAFVHEVDVDKWLDN